MIGAILVTLVATWMVDKASHLLGLVAFAVFCSLALQPLMLMMLNRWPTVKRGAAVLSFATQVGLDWPVPGSERRHDGAGSALPER